MTMTENCATIVVVPRDHFSDTEDSLESVIAHSPPDCPIVYVDGGSPARAARYLRNRRTSRPFELMRYDHYLTPNQARNAGMRRVTTRYAVFVDNDVVCAPDWLPPLVACADATGAAVVGPLNHERRPLHQIVHFAGGDVGIEAGDAGGGASRRLIDRIHKVPASDTWYRTDEA
jgi:GT2 family glycosyltransferase